EIVALEVYRTASIDTVMRNDAPSVHLLSAYLRTRVCLDYLRIAIGPTIEVVAQLGCISLDPDLATVYQDWARMQTTVRMPPVVSAVEAASYTEVQNLSRRRHGHLVRVARHCLFDIFGARDRIPAGLTAICASLLLAIRYRFPEADEAKRHSLVGSMFFLRFVNAALTMPAQYGLLDAPPTGAVKTNLKLIARLMQRMSNYSWKPPEEWPADACQFMKDNIADFQAFLASLTSGPDVPPPPPRDGAGRSPPARRTHSATVLIADCGAVAGPRLAVSPVPIPSLAATLAAALDTTAGGGGSAGAECARATSIDDSICAVFARGMPPIDDDSPGASADAGRPARPGSAPPLTENAQSRRQAKGVSWDEPRLPRASGAAGGPAQPPSTAAARSAKGASRRPYCAPAEAFAQHQARWCGREHSSSPGNRESSASDSVQSMFGMGHAPGGKGGGGRRASRTGRYGDVVLPLNDLYLLQKHLLMYEDAWAPGEAERHRGPGQRVGDTPMRTCLAALGPAPGLVRASNNHATRIPLE
ncbi:RasGAP protein, partial [Coemansia biformis]